MFLLHPLVPSKLHFVGAVFSIFASFILQFPSLSLFHSTFFWPNF